MAKQKYWDGEKWVQVSPSMEEFTTHLADETSHVYYGEETGTANAKVVAINPAITSYKKGMEIRFINKTANTGATTINANGIGAVSLLKESGTALTSAYLRANTPYKACFNGTAFILLGKGGEYGTAGAPQVLEGYTVGTENGIVAGLLKKGAILKIIQRGSVRLPFQSTSVIVPVTPYDTSKAYVSFTWSNKGSGGDQVTVTPQGNYGLSFNNRSNSSGDTEIDWELIEYEDGVSVQTGTMAISDGNSESPVDIAPVNPSRSIVILSYRASSNISGYYVYNVRGEFIANNKLLLKRMTTNGSQTVRWYVVEYLKN